MMLQLYRAITIILCEWYENPLVNILYANSLTSQIKILHYEVWQTCNDSEREKTRISINHKSYGSYFDRKKDENAIVMKLPNLAQSVV